MKENLEPALAAAEAEAKAATDAAAREQAGRAEAELRAINASKNLNGELEAERVKARDLGENMRILEKVRYLFCCCCCCCCPRRRPERVIVRVSEFVFCCGPRPPPMSIVFFQRLLCRVYWVRSVEEHKEAR